MNKLPLFLLMLLLIPAVTAIGISPSKVCFERSGDTYNLLDMFCDKTIATFLPGQTYAGKVCAIGENYSAGVYVRGPFEGLVNISKEDLYLPARQSVCVLYTFILPENVTEPGVHETLIGVIEKDPATSGVFPIITSAVQQLQVILPYPDLYLEAELKASSANVSKPVILALTLTNFGKMTASASGEIIISSNNKQVDSLEIVQIEIVAGASEYKTLNWTTKKAGNYTATAKVEYDEKTAESTASFEVLAKPWNYGLSPATLGFLVIILIIIVILIAVIGGNYYLKKHEK